MNIITSFITAFILFLQPAAKNEDVTIRGAVTNADQMFVTLNYNPWLRGNPCYEGFSSIGAAVDKEGNFELALKNITNAAEYNLSFGREGINFPLFKGDNVTFAFDAKNFNQTFFATGNGAGKINVVNLEQFKDRMYYPEKWTSERFAAHKDSLIAAQLLLLDEIYNMKTNSKIITAEKNGERIKRIVNDSPLSREEYTFLKNQATMNRFLILNFGTEKTDFTSSAFKYFSKKEYDKVANIDYKINQHRVYTILQAEYIKSISKENQDITYDDWDKLLGSKTAYSWMLAYLKNNFPAQIHDKIISELLMAGLTQGDVSENTYLHFKENCTDKNYRNYVAEYMKTQEDAINDARYDLNFEKLTLNAKTFEVLINRHQGEDVLVVFWSAQYAGAFVMNNLSTLAYLEKHYSLKVINICIDKGDNKKLWASKIVQGNWKGEHYFMPSESNETTLKNFSSKKIEAFCNGGATYTIIEKSGTIHNNIENPLLLSAGKMNSYLH